MLKFENAIKSEATKKYYNYYLGKFVSWAKLKNPSDLLIFEPQTFKDASGRTVYDLESWSDSVVAVEVEADPTKHVEQVVTNYGKNREKNYSVWFAVFSEAHKQFIIDELAARNITLQDYSIFVLDESEIIKSYENYHSTTHVSELEAEVLSMFGKGPGTDRMLGQVNVSSEAALEVLRSLEKKDLVSVSQVDVAKKTTDHARGRQYTSHRKVQVVEITNKGKMALDGQSGPATADKEDDQLQKPPQADTTADGKIDYAYDRFSTQLLKKIYNELQSEREKEKVRQVLSSRSAAVSEKNRKETDAA
jgi:hypothetical protein